MLEIIFSVFLLYLVIFDPFMSTASFVSLTRGFSEKERKRIAMQASAIAAFLVLAIIFSGTAILDTLSINMEDFKVAGGVVLALLGIQMVMGFDFSSREKHGESSAIATIIATPLITGPAAIMATLISTGQYGWFPVFVAAGSALVIVSVCLYFANRLMRMIGKPALTVLSTIFGLVTLAWGVSFIRQGIAGL
ncbi:hypothetical protein COU37_02860 [Candidatus Micrarchaeota archaeon CG10_big_fil_rev_8_21_14_0_10_45_29]|nr:MAG: hypothetical protein COU37_02860 [Candidatus Micrarchaeota archaeon CG10_big_fil_rev_8_21_14_0_10_45_29]